MEKYWKQDFEFLMRCEDYLGKINCRTGLSM